MILDFTITYSAYFLFQQVGIKLANNKNKNISKSNGNRLKLESITLIIPFRNEINRITELLDSINKSSVLPFEIIFIDDHSSDSSDLTITTFLQKKTIPYKILKLPQSKSGKKEAIRHGILNAHKNTRFILTFDADIAFSNDYFEKLKEKPERELYILPVKMKGDTFLKSLFSLDYNLLNIVNIITYGFNRPILASGANLLFKKKIFIQWDSFDSHKHISSGDDMFLLRDFIKNNASIVLLSDKKLTVQTPSPKNIKSLLQQRSRWITKNKAIKDQISNLTMYLNLLVLFFFYATLIKSAYSADWLEFVIVFFLKNILDIVTMSSYKVGAPIYEKSLIPIYSIIQPFYYISLILFPIFSIIKWKDRAIKKG